MTRQQCMLITQALRDFYEYHTVPYCDLSPERRVELSDIRRLIANAAVALAAECDEPAKPEVGPMRNTESRHIGEPKDSETFGRWLYRSESRCGCILTTHEHGIDQLWCAEHSLHQ